MLCSRSMHAVPLGPSVAGSLLRSQETGNAPLKTLLLYRGQGQKLSISGCLVARYKRPSACSRLIKYSHPSTRSSLELLEGIALPLKEQEG